MATCRVGNEYVSFSSSSTHGSGTSAHATDTYVHLTSSSASVLSLKGPAGAAVKISNIAAPSASTDVATKSYVDAHASGLHMYGPVDYATGTSINDGNATTAQYVVALHTEPATISSVADSGFTRTFNDTFNAASGLSADTVVPVVGMRILIKSSIAGGGALSFTGSDKKLAGIWYFSSVDATNPTYVWTLTRAPDMSDAGEVYEGGFTVVSRGVQAGQSWGITTDFLRYGQPGGSGAYLNCTGTAGSTTLTIRRSGSAYTLAAPEAESLSYVESTYRNENSGVTYIRAGQGLKCGNFYYLVSADSTAATTITLASALRETLADAPLRFGLNLKASDADDVASSISYMSNDNTHYLGFTQMFAGTTYTGDANISVTGSTIGLISSPTASALPMQPTHLANKKYVDRNPAKPSARVATTAAIADIAGAWTYNTTQMTLTAGGAGGHPDIDDVALVVGDYVLIKDGFSGSSMTVTPSGGVGSNATDFSGANGLYVVTTLGSGSLPAHVYTRVQQMDETEDFSGAKIQVEEGTTNAGKTFKCNVTPNTNASTPFTLHSATAANAAISFTELAGSGGSYTAGAGLTDTSGTFAVVNATNGGLTVNANDVQLNLYDLATATLAADDGLAFIDTTGSNATKRGTVAELATALAGEGGTITASSGVLTAASVTIGTTAIAPGSSSATIAGLTSLTGDSAGLTLAAGGSSQNVRINPTDAGTVLIGGSSPTIFAGAGASGLVVGFDADTKLTMNTTDATFNCNLNATVFNTSDERLKHDIVRIASAGEKLDLIGGYTFAWNKDDSLSCGCMAQEVEVVLGASAVHTVADEETEAGEKKVLQYNGVIAILVEAVKEERATVRDLKARLEALEQLQLAQSAQPAQPAQPVGRAQSKKSGKASKKNGPRAPSTAVCCKDGKCTEAECDSDCSDCSKGGGDDQRHSGSDSEGSSVSSGTRSKRRGSGR